MAEHGTDGNGAQDRGDATGGQRPASAGARPSVATPRASTAVPRPTPASGGAGTGPRPDIPEVKVRRPTAQDVANVLVEEFLVAAAEDAKHAPKPLRETIATLPRFATAVGLALACVALWGVELFRPADPGRLKPACVDQRQGLLRLRVAAQAQRVRAFEARTGALPASLGAMGDSLRGVTYFRRGDDRFEVSAIDGKLLVAYRSELPLDEFVGDAIGAVNRRCQ